MGSYVRQVEVEGCEPERVLLVDDNPTNLQVLFQTLKDEGYKLFVAKGGEEAIENALKTKPHLILLDIMMPPGIDGYETCRRLKENEETRDAAVIFLSSLDDTKDKVMGFEAGAVDFVTKPFQAEEIIARVNTHLTVQRLQKDLLERNETLERQLRVAEELLKEANTRVEGPLLGASPAVASLKQEIARCAASEDAVVLIGPLGTGKEAVARAIHHESTRGSQAFIQVNCALIQTGSYSMFGEEPLPGTAPPGGRSGRFQVALGGTIYLDGLNRLPPETQAQLAAVLSGLATDSSLDVRVIASNASSLDEDIPQSRLDPRLHRALAAHQVRVPTLAERRDDIPAIAEHFAKQHSRVLGKSIDSISASSLQRLQDYRWPGNFKELKSVVERAVTMCQSTLLEIDESFLEEGVSIGSYRLVEKLGAGGMGEVWLAKHQMLARPAAVKLIRQEGQLRNDGMLLQRFRREAEATAGLRSPNTVELYDFGVSDSGEFYYVMECLDGIDLDRMVRQYGIVPPERAVHLLKQVCRSLAEAHDAKLIHRDIKPANLFSCRLGAEFDFVKVLDFGMVKAQQGDESLQLTAADSFSGTPATMAPEIAVGGDADGRVDLYSLGCVAFWLLTGSDVFQAENSTQMIVKHVREQPVAPSELSEEVVPEALDEIVLRCLQKKPDDRPGDARELWEALDGLTFPKPWTNERAREWWQRLATPEGQAAR